jgi:hypothetical protein
MGLLDDVWWSMNDQAFCGNVIVGQLEATLTGRP